MNIFNKISASVGKIGDLFKSGVGNKIGDLVRRGGAGLANLGRGIVEGAKTLLKKPGVLFNNIKDKIEQFKNMYQNIQGKINSMVNLGNTVMERTQQAQEMGLVIKDKTLNAIKDIQNIAQNVAEKVPEMLNKIRDFSLVGGIDSTYTTYQLTRELERGTLEKTAKQLEQKISGIPETIKEIQQSFKNAAAALRSGSDIVDISRLASQKNFIKKLTGDLSNSKEMLKQVKDQMLEFID